MSDEIHLRDERCPGCHNFIDPGICCCGVDRENHGNPMDEGHSFVPMGCRCLANDTPGVERCRCGQLCDLNICWCGATEGSPVHANKNGRIFTSHAFTPSGCICRGDPPYWHPDSPSTEPCDGRCQAACCEHIRSFRRECNQPSGHDGPCHCDGNRPNDVVFQRAIYARVDIDIDIRFRVDDSHLCVDLRLNSLDKYQEQMNGKLRLAVPPGTQLVERDGYRMLVVPDPPPDPMLQNIHMRAGAAVVLGIYRLIQWAARSYYPKPTDDASKRFSLLELD